MNLKKMRKVCNNLQFKLEGIERENLFLRAEIKRLKKLLKANK